MGSSASERGSPVLATVALKLCSSLHTRCIKLSPSSMLPYPPGDLMFLNISANHSLSPLQRTAQPATQRGHRIARPALQPGALTT
ncbi:hypothetical protein DL93DRAFT_2083760 [Clavulina sp. PMI_390]|nr:hypothetical protein DL93DRAFT_2083760 [Clavulina sp. PMI_390]